MAFKAVGIDHRLTEHDAVGVIEAARRQTSPHKQPDVERMDRDLADLCVGFHERFRGGEVGVVEDAVDDRHNAAGSDERQEVRREAAHGRYALFARPKDRGTPNTFRRLACSVARSMVLSTLPST